MMKRLYLLLAAILTCVVLSAQTSPFAGMGIVDYKITSVWPESFREVSGEVDAMISNSGTTRKVTDITANVYRNGAAFASGVCSDVTFVKGKKKYTLEGRVKLAQGVSIWTAIGAALSFSPSEYVVEVSMVMTYEDGTVQPITRKVPLTRFLN